jgi:hypothetical protein
MVEAGWLASVVVEATADREEESMVSQHEVLD